MVTIKHADVTWAAHSRLDPRAVLMEEVMRKLSLVGLEPTHVSAKLTMFPGMSLKEEHQPFLLRAIREKQGATDGLWWKN
jgi:hypothetical protein